MKKIIFITLIITLILILKIKVPSVYSQSCTTASTANDAVIQDGLVKGSALTRNLYTFGNAPCAIDPDRTKVPTFSIPTFAQLKSVYFDQVKSTSIQKHDPLGGNKTQTHIPLSGTTDHLYYIQKANPASADGNLTISGNPSGTMTGVVFVEGNLNINNNLTYGTNTSGIVFIVQGNIYINPSVTEVDAVILTLGKFCSGWNGSCAALSNSTPLTIKGSIISLSKNLSDKPVFNRSMADNSTPVEKIIFQPKYLVITKSLLGKDTNIWSEVQ